MTIRIIYNLKKIIETNTYNNNKIYNNKSNKITTNKMFKLMTIFWNRKYINKNKLKMKK